MLQRAQTSLLFMTLGIVLVGCESLITPPSTPSEFEALQDASDAYLAYERGDCKAAAEMSSPEVVEGWAPNEIRYSTLLLHGFCQELEGDQAAAIQTYQNLVQSAPSSFAARDALDRMRVLEAEAQDPAIETRRSEAHERATQDQSPRVPIKRKAAQFPPMPREVGIEGYAVVEFSVTPRGKTTDPLILDSSPRLLFDGASLRAIRQWEYAQRANARTNDRQIIKLVFVRDAPSDPEASSAQDDASSD